MDFRNKIEDFLRNKNNFIFLGILLIAFVIRLYYFIHIYNQTLWWDEAEYMSMAKNLLYGVPFDFNPQRPILFPLMISLFLWIGEGAVRFFISFLPSLGVVVLTYLFGKEIYNKEIGLISSFIMTVFWVLIFNGTRIHADGMALFFSILGIYLFWIGYVKNKSFKILNLAFLFLVISFMIKVNAILATLIVFLFLLITEKIDFLKKKILWKSSIWFVIPLVPYFIYNYIKFGNIFSFATGYVTPSSLTQKFQSSFNWSIFDFTYIFTYKLFFVLFLIGALFSLLNLVLGFDLIYRKNDVNVKADLLSILSVLTVIGWFVFIERWNAEPRWLILMAPFMFFIIGRGMLDVVKYLKIDKKIVFILIVLILFIGAYPQLKYTNDLVDAKLHSYEPVKLSGLWMKEHSDKDDIIMSKSVPQHTYYSERYVVGFPSTNEEINEIKPKYLVISIFELHEPEMLNRIESINSHMQIVNGYFMDSEGKQPTLVVYQFKDYDF